MRLACISLIYLIFTANLVSAQKGDTPLFSDQKPLDIKIAFSIKEVKGITIDTIYTAAKLHYKNGENWDSMMVDVRARGNFRRKECYYPPIRLKVNKDKGKGNVFEGNKSLKLVLPCRQMVKDNSLIMKEFICYKMYEPLTKYTFKTRLVNLELTDAGNKKAKPVQFLAFLIEDDDLVAKHHKGRIVEDMKLHPKALQDSNSVRHDLFQYMIANTDWSTTFLHNAKVLELKESKQFIPLAYDFDMAGFVNAPYASVNADLGIASVRERLYRGFCRAPEVMQAIRKEFLNKESLIKKAIADNSKDIDPKEVAGMNKYMDDFFNTLKSDNKFKAEVMDKCRTK